jgi:4-diphosphocytidyl-2-C-methyl-D-erythritol kinase
VPAASETAPAKVNLYLHILGRRPDGYHRLDSLAVFPAVGDRLTAAPAASLALAVGGQFAAGLASADNLVLRAARALAAAAGEGAGARMTLEKCLPVASGIGGGSADAAAALRLLARLWQVQGVDLAAVAARLGADVPVCLAGRPVRMAGVGEVLSPAPHLPRFGIALVNPGTPLATASVFRARTGGFQTPAALPAGWDDAAAMAAALRGLENGLEAAARGLCPAISAALAALAAQPGCLLARMSGSGATCFGLFATAAAAAAAAASIARRAPGWWAWGGGGSGAGDRS